MNILEIITKKRDKKVLTKKEIEYFIKEYTQGNITDYHVAALVMAIYLNGMNEREATDLAISMASSGEKLELTGIFESVVDKHSTGGVGDKITLILMPTIASLGIPVAKMSGRGLGFTGGTIDKLESIPGYKTDISIEQFLCNVQNIGISLIGQTLNLAPADKKLYALRDTIGCVDSMALIASSIMSKKIASGATKIVLDVTVGSGAFMKNMDNAVILSELMNNIGKLANIETMCVLTNMDEPLGHAVGNNLEVIEAIECLKGNMPKDVEDVVTTLGAYILKLSKKGNNISQNKKVILEAIKDGSAFNKLIELVKIQGGDTSYIENIEKFEKAKYVLPVICKKNGYIEKINAEDVGKVSLYLGAGRINKEDEIDHSVGIILNQKVSSKVKEGDVLAYIHANDEDKGIRAVEDLMLAYKIVPKVVKKKENILGIVE
jgi:pyrimidine-nucleoside phosphorylase